MKGNLVTLHSKSRGEGPPVLLLHGLFGSMDNLNALAKNLEGSFTVHQLDLRNHGRSPHTDEMSYSAMSDDVLRYLDDKKLNKVYIVGHSMGGKVAMQCALSQPERIAKLVVLDIAPVRYPAHHNDIFAALKSVSLQSLQSRQEAESLLSTKIKHSGTRAFLLKSLTKGSNKNFQWRFNLNAIDKQYDQIMEGQSEGQVYNGAVLFVGGGDSDYLKQEYSETTKTLFPKVQVKIVPGVGHWLHAEKPELIAGLCLRFFQSE